MGSVGVKDTHSKNVHRPQAELGTTLASESRQSWSERCVSVAGKLSLFEKEGAGFW